MQSPGILLSKFSSVMLMTSITKMCLKITHYPVWPYLPEGNELTGSVWLLSKKAEDIMNREIGSVTLAPCHALLLVAAGGTDQYRLLNSPTAGVSAGLFRGDETWLVSLLVWLAWINIDWDHSNAVDPGSDIMHWELVWRVAIPYCFSKATESPLHTFGSRWIVVQETVKESKINRRRCHQPATEGTAAWATSH